MKCLLLASLMMLAAGCAHDSSKAAPQIPVGPTIPAKAAP